MLFGVDVEIKTALDPKLDRIWADRGQMHQVLMNLTMNARDAMPSGGRCTSGRHPLRHSAGCGRSSRGVFVATRRMICIRGLNQFAGAGRILRITKSYAPAPITPPSSGPAIGTQNTPVPSVSPLFLNPATTVNSLGPKSRAGLIA